MDMPGVCGMMDDIDAAVRALIASEHEK